MLVSHPDVPVYSCRCQEIGKAQLISVFCRPSADNSEVVRSRQNHSMPYSRRSDSLILSRKLYIVDVLVKTSQEEGKKEQASLLITRTTSSRSTEYSKNIVLFENSELHKLDLRMQLYEIEYIDSILPIRVRNCTFGNITSLRDLVRRIDSNSGNVILISSRSQLETLIALRSFLGSVEQCCGVAWRLSTYMTPSNSSHSHKSTAETYVPPIFS